MPESVFNFIMFFKILNMKVNCFNFLLFILTILYSEKLKEEKSNGIYVMVIWYNIYYASLPCCCCVGGHWHSASTICWKGPAAAKSCGNSLQAATIQAFGLHSHTTPRQGAIDTLWWRTFQWHSSKSLLWLKMYFGLIFFVTLLPCWQFMN